ncbi:MAG TPA: hypothetical protein VK928_03370, partial [Longimicrobiales bacterium]|nr:hypothetical protein [Longimicrobiales bacterium]
YTRLTLVSAPCAGTTCDDAAPLMLGRIGGQRAADYASLDLMAAWTHSWTSASLTVHAQLRNALGRSNAVTYHSSCLCIQDQAGSEAWLGDTFDPGLPRLPIIGLRVRF